MKILSKYLLVCFFLIAPSLSFSASTANKTALNLIVDEYNKNIKDLDSLLIYLSKKNPNRKEELKDFFTRQKMPLQTKVPPLTVEGDHLLFVDTANQKWELLPIANGLIKITHNQKQREIKLSMSPDEILKQVEYLSALPKTANVLELFISNANAEGIGDAVGIVASGIYAAVAFGTLGALDSIDRTLRDIAKIPGSFSEKSVREKATKACEDLSQGKPVKNIDKIKTNLEELKKKVNCVPFWESFMENSCAWFDERIACLTQGSVEIHDGSRSADKKPNTTDSPAATPTNSAAEK